MGHYCIDCGYYECRTRIDTTSKFDIFTRCRKSGQIVSPLWKRECWVEKGMEEELLPKLNDKKMGHKVARYDSHRIINK